MSDDGQRLEELWQRYEDVTDELRRIAPHLRFEAATQEHAEQVRQNEQDAAAYRHEKRMLGRKASAEKVRKSDRLLERVDSLQSEKPKQYPTDTAAVRACLEADDAMWWAGPDSERDTKIDNACRRLRRARQRRSRRESLRRLAEFWQRLQGWISRD